MKPFKGEEIIILNTFPSSKLLGGIKSENVKNLYLSLWKSNSLFKVNR